MLTRSLRSILLITLLAAMATIGGQAVPHYTTVAPGVEVWPAPGEMIESEQPITVHLSGDVALPGEKPIRIYLDNVNVTQLCSRNGADITISVPTTLSGGLHHMTLVLPSLLTQGRRAVWSFQTPAPVEAELHDAVVNVTNNVTKRTLYEGDALEVTATGPAGGKATASVGKRFSFPLHEQFPGTYVGRYLIRRTDYVVAAPVRVRITMPNGHVFGNRSANDIKVFGQIFTVRVISPVNDEKVPFNFVIVGHTRPNARVSISPTIGIPSGTAQPGQNGQPPNVTKGMGGWDVTADENGNFRQAFGFPIHAFNVSYSFFLTATDKDGEQAIPSTLHVIMTSKPNATKTPAH